MSVTNSDVIGAQVEKVRPKLQEWYETSNTVASLIKKASESHRVSAWSAGTVGSGGVAAFRIPIQIYRGGDFGTFSYDEGDLGGGSMMKVQFMTIGYFPTRLAVEISSLAAEATATSEQSVVNVFKYQLANAIKEIQAYDDISFHQDGTGVVAKGDGVTAPSGSTVYGLEANFGPQRLRYNQPVDVYSSDFTTLRTAALRVSSINWNLKQVTLNGAVTSPTSSDVLAINGMSATLAVGSYKNGIYTFNSSATSGTTLGINRATYSEIVTPNISASGPLVPAHGLALNDQIIQRRDPEIFNGMIGIAHQAQRAAVYLSGIAISEWHRGSGDKMIDITPKDVGQNSQFTWTGVKHYVSKRQDRSRIDWLNPKLWGRAMLHDLKFFEVEGRRVFELRSSGGTVKAGMLFYLVQAENFYSADPGGAGFVSALTLPAGY